MIDNKVGKITKKEIMELCPDISKVTVERTLTDLVKSGYIAKVGAGPSTGYVRILCPDISKVTVERTLTDLVKSGYIAKVGAGPSTGYVRI